MAQIIRLLASPWLWLAFAGLAAGLGLLAWRLGLRWKPALGLRLLLVGLALLGAFWPNRGGERPGLAPRQALVVDQSDSLDEESRRQALRQALAWQAGGENRLVVAFGSRAEAVLGEAVAGALDGRASELAGALRLAAGLIGPNPAAGPAPDEPGQLAAPDPPPGRIILVSDGRASQPAAVEQAVQALAGQGLRLDVIPLAGRAAAGDLALGDLAAPANLWAGMPFDLLAPVYGTGAGQAARLRLSLDGRVSEISPEVLEDGSYRFHIPSLAEGIVTVQVTAAWPEGERVDPFPGNNAAYAVLKVFAAPPVLFVSAEPEAEAARSFTARLARSKIPLTAIRPAEMPTRLDVLQQYRVIVLHNLLASQLSGEQMTALQVFTARQAGGLVFLGGRSSYTLGGYQGTPLEPLLPVRLEPPPRSLRPPMAFTLILDRSSSMSNYSPLSQEAAPIALAREAAMRTIETMKAEDYLGLLSFSDEPEWDFPLRAIGGAAGMREALDAVSRIQADGSTYMFAALQEALAGMSALPAEAPVNRHILLLSDGQSTDGEDPEFIRLVQAGRDQGITVSAIALGDDVNSDLMTRMAEAGQGRFYAVQDAADLPHIMIAESQAARSENVQAGQTGLKVGAPGHPILLGINLPDLPRLSGYNALRSKADAGAEDVLVSASFDDPALATWQYGLGRVSAWMGDLGEEWTQGWTEAAAGQFWSQVVRYSLADPAGGPAQATVTVEADRLKIDAAIYTLQGEPLNLAEVVFTYADPPAAGQPGGGQTHSFRLPQQTAGMYGLEIPRPAQGAYRAALSYTDQAGRKVEVPAPFAVNPPREWQPVEPTGGQAALLAWAKTTGGGPTRLETAPREAAAPPSIGGRLAGLAADPWQRLLLAVVILWPLEIAIRRRWLPWMA